MLRLRVGDHVLFLDSSGREYEVELTDLSATAAQGVAAFVPIVSSRSLVRSAEASPARLERWRRVIVEAAEQSGRCRLPDISLPLPFDDACASAAGVRILLWEGERDASLAAVLAAHQRALPAVSLFIGPEGGFPLAEVQFARRLGVRTVSLGRRILRAETAAIVAAALVLHELGDLKR